MLIAIAKTAHKLSAFCFITRENSMLTSRA